MWDILLTVGKDVIVKAWKNKLTVQLANGAKIVLKGADKPDTLVGSGLWYCVMDEFADQKPEVWEQSIRPALADHKGGALFIGTPEGLNHFYDLWKMGQDPERTQWASFQFNSIDNPIIGEEELTEAAKDMSQEMFEQEFQASFTSGGGTHLRRDDLKEVSGSPAPGQIYIAIDPAGFGGKEAISKSKLKKLDEHAIAIVEVSTAGWYIHDILHGRWDIRETSLKIVKAVQRYRPVSVGIEGGALKNALGPYLEDQMNRLRVYFTPERLTHGGNKKEDRIIWALQGRLENGRLFARKDAPFLKHLYEQMNQFPSPMAHDDLIDALAYIDQLAEVPYNIDTIGVEEQDWDNVYY
jgi:predicted phage terminase large subunit-like protein